MYIVSNVNIIHGANELASILIRRNFYTRFELIRGIPGTTLLFPTNENRLELTTSAPSSQHRINYINEIPLSSSIIPSSRSLSLCVYCSSSAQVLHFLCYPFPMLYTQKFPSLHQFFAWNRDKCFINMKSTRKNR